MLNMYESWGVKGEDCYFFTLTHQEWEKSYISTIKYVFTDQMISLDFERIQRFIEQKLLMNYTHIL
jgi:hypothetical protein